MQVSIFVGDSTPVMVVEPWQSPTLDCLSTSAVGRFPLAGKDDGS